MLAWMDREALRCTLVTGRATYWSRSRQEYWVKGETSGHSQQVVSVRLDCDGDTLLLRVNQTGPACHTGTPTCSTRSCRWVPHPNWPPRGTTTKPGIDAVSDRSDTPEHASEHAPSSR